MNLCLMLTHNGLEITKRSVESVFAQDSETHLVTIDNGSTDGTQDWFQKNHKVSVFIPEDRNLGVSKSWNTGLELLLMISRHDHCLVINNDTVLPPWFYSELLSYNVPFVTGVSVDNMDTIRYRPPRAPLVGHPDFSAFLIRRDAWDKIGPFDEGMKFYAQDCDYHVRACRAGVPLLAANLPFYHERSSTLRLASPAEQAEIQSQANADRAYFQKKWGWPVGSEEYQQATRTQGWNGCVDEPDKIKLA
jgi:GT2 family glycosyltransferase